jgi:hypothetical protein
MKRIFYALVVFCCVSGSAIAAPYVEWSRILPMNGEAISVVQTPDGGYVVAGKRFSPDQAVVFRTDHNGDTLWSRSFPSPSGGWAIINRVLIDSESNIVVAGGCYNSGLEAFLRKYSENGTFLWQHTWATGGPTLDGFNDVEFTPEGGYIAGGCRLIVKTDQSGDTLWTRQLTESDNHFVIRDIVVDSDSTYLIASTTWNPIYALFFKIRSNGSQDWAHIGPYGEVASAIKPLRWATDMVGFGTGNPSDYHGQPLWMRVPRGTGIPIQSGTVVGPNVCRITSALTLPTEGYILGGWSGTSAYSHRGLLLKLSPFLSTEWTYTFTIDPDSGMPLTNVNGMAVTSDSGFIAVGRTSRSENQTWLFQKYCSEWADAGSLTMLKSGPPDWGFALDCSTSRLQRFAVTGINLDASGAVSGLAAEHWTVLPGGDGNNGDSIVFVTSHPLEYDAIDTFWVRGVNDTCRNLACIVGCPKFTIPLWHGGHIVQICDMARGTGFRLTVDSARIGRVAFTSFLPGTVGSISGPAVQSWNVLANGDGNNGDSIIFETQTPVTIGSVDTLWLQMPSSECQVSWSAGFSSGTIPLLRRGYMEELSATDTSVAFSVHHESGSIARCVFTGGEPGMTGHVAGNAEGNWSVRPNGDGNNGDSVIFEATTPLTSGTIDTFWVSRPGDSCQLRIEAGCADTLWPTLLCCLDSIRFWGAEMDGYVEFQVAAYNAHGIEAYEILRRDQTTSAFILLATFPATAPSDYHEYSYNQYGPRTYYQYMVAALDSFGCRKEFADQILTRRRNLYLPESGGILPKRHTLSCHPNPFNPSTTLSFTLPKSGLTSIAVYDVTGRKVETLRDGMMETGEHQVKFDGSQLPSGLYFARFQSGEFNATQKLLLLK